MKKFIAGIDISLMLSVVSLVLLIGFAANAHAAQEVKSEVRINRYVVAVSANYGGAGRPVLRYAESDAKSFANVLKEMGGVPAQNVIMVNEPSIAKFMERLDNLDKKILDGKPMGGRDEVLVYYSGHADDKGLRLGNENLAWKNLRSRIDNLHADVKIAVIDACGSGAITRAKGGVAVPAFMVDESSDMKGYAFITSSTQDESSQESDELKGSFFTHSLVSGLRGAGDLSGDGKVTLSEAYQFAFNETLQKTETTMGGAQHPSRDMNLAGTGDVVMTDLRSTGAGMDIADNIEGRLYIHDEKGELVAELNKKSGRPMSLGLPAGKYTVNLQRNAEYGAATIALANGKRAKINRNDFQTVSAEQTVLRGEIGGHSSCADGDTAKCSLDSLDHNGKFRVTFNVLDQEQEPRKGLQLGLFLASAESYMRGAQVSLLANVAKKEMHGVQVSLLANVDKEHFEGLQLNTVLNYANSFNGSQISSTLNVAAKKSNGVQVGGLISVAADTLNGLQVSTINVARQTNVQISTMNFAKYSDVQVSSMNFAHEVNKVQVGVINYANNARGRQWGIVNIAPHAEKTPVGLINIVGNGVWSLSGIFNEMGGTGMKFDLGTAYFYTSFEVSRNFAEGERFKHYDSHFQNGFGIGTHFGRYGTHLDLEYMFINVTEEGFGIFDIDTYDDSVVFSGRHVNESEILNRVRLGATCQLFPGVGLTGGVSMNLLFRANGGYDEGLLLKPIGDYHADIMPSKKFGRYWPGFYAGLTIGRF